MSLVPPAVLAQNHMSRLDAEGEIGIVENQSLSRILTRKASKKTSGYVQPVGQEARLIVRGKIRTGAGRQSSFRFPKPNSAGAQIL